MTTTANVRTQRTMSYRVLRVSVVRRLTPHMTRITFGAEDLGDYAGYAPDHYVKLFFPLPDQQAPEVPEIEGDDTVSWYRSYLEMPDERRPPMRTYTVRRHRPERGEIDVDFVLHGDHGPASRFASHAKPGQLVGMLGPGGIYQPPEEHDWQLLIGDETAMPAIGAILAELPAGTPVRVYVQIGDQRDRQRFETDAEADVHWIPRTGAGEPLLDAVRAAQLPEGTPYVWISGEAGMVKTMRRHMVRDRGVDKRLISFTGYWRQGKTEDQTAQESLAAAARGDTTDDD